MKASRSQMDIWFSTFTQTIWLREGLKGYTKLSALGLSNLWLWENSGNRKCPLVYRDRQWNFALLSGPRHICCHLQRAVQVGRFEMRIDGEWRFMVDITCICVHISIRGRGTASPFWTGIIWGTHSRSLRAPDLSRLDWLWQLKQAARIHRAGCGVAIYVHFLTSFDICLCHCWTSGWKVSVSRTWLPFRNCK